MMILGDKKFNKYMENVNSAYVLLAEHVESLERRLAKVDNSSFEIESEEYKKIETEKLSNFDEKEVDN